MFEKFLILGIEVCGQNLHILIQLLINFILLIIYHYQILLNLV